VVCSAAVPATEQIPPSGGNDKVGQTTIRSEKLMSQQRTYYVCTMASKSRVLYIGVTGFLMQRVLQHRAGNGGEFTRRYRVHRLVYFQGFHNVGDALHAKLN
jgi:predicted GIY-YIG superfamily endonuclease